MVGLLEQAPHGARSFQRAAVNRLAIAEVRESRVPANRDAFIALMQRAQDGAELRSLRLAPLHQRALARLLALNSKMRGLTTGLTRQYTRTIDAFVQDAETRRFLLDLERRLGAAEAARGLNALLIALEAQLSPLLSDAAFSRLYLEDRYHLILGELRSLS